MNVTVDQEKCCGAGLCRQIAPEVFGERHDGIVTLLRPTPAAQHHGAVRDAAEQCPTDAIEVHDEVYAATGWR